MGNKIEMQIMQEVEKNTVLINLGIFLDVPTARIRTTEHIQKNIDRRESMLLLPFGYKGVGVPAPKKNINSRAQH